MILSALAYLQTLSCAFSGCVRWYFLWVIKQICLVHGSSRSYSHSLTLPSFLSILQAGCFNATHITHKSITETVSGGILSLGSTSTSTDGTRSSPVPILRSQSILTDVVESPKLSGENRTDGSDIAGDVRSSHDSNQNHQSKSLAVHRDNRPPVEEVQSSPGAFNLTVGPTPFARL
jgi:hypothetical protein